MLGQLAWASSFSRTMMAACTSSLWLKERYRGLLDKFTCRVPWARGPLAFTGCAWQVCDSVVISRVDGVTTVQRSDTCRLDPAAAFMPTGVNMNRLTTIALIATYDCRQHHVLSLDLMWGIASWVSTTKTSAVQVCM